jgi:hypothetical protein
MMRRFLLIGGLDGQVKALAKLHALVQERRPDGVLCAGGIVGEDSVSHAEKLKTWEECFDGLGKLGVFTAMIPGAADAPLREFLRLAKDAEVDYAASTRRTRRCSRTAMRQSAAWAVS